MLPLWSDGSILGLSLLARDWRWGAAGEFQIACAAGRAVFTNGGLSSLALHGMYDWHWARATCQKKRCDNDVECGGEFGPEPISQPQAEAEP
jgi:hypothetical protein